MLLIAGCASQVDSPGPLVASPRLSSALDQLLPPLAEPRLLAWRATADPGAEEILVASAPTPPPPSPPRPHRRPPVQVHVPAHVQVHVQAQAEPARSPPRPPLPPVPAPAKPVRPHQIAWIPKLKPGLQPSPAPVTVAQVSPLPAPSPSPAKPDLAPIMPAAGPLAALRPPLAHPLRATAPARMALVEGPLAGLAPGAARPGDGMPAATTPSVQIATSTISRAATDAVAVGGDDAGLGALSMAAREALLAGDPATALGLYEQLALIVPNQRTALLGRAIALGQLGHHGEAQAAYQALLEADPDDRAARMAYLGLLAEVAPEQALHELRRLARRHPDDAGLLGQIALAEAGRGDLTRAVAMLRRAVALDPMNPQHRINLAVMYDRSGHQRAAIEHYQKALALAMRSGQVTLPLDAIDARLRHLRRQAP